MKKLKLLPTVLMLVLCVGVLAIGVYAISPTKNSITGSITVTASNPAFTIQVYHIVVDGETGADGTRTPFGTPYTVRGGLESLGIGTIAYNLSQANTLSDVDNYKIELEVTSEAGEDLGMYFFVGSTPQAQLKTSAITEIEGLGEAIEISFSDYTRLPEGESASAYINVTLKSFPENVPEEGTTIDLSTLNISFNIVNYDLNSLITDENAGSLGYKVVGKNQTTLSSIGSLGTFTKVKVAEGVQYISGGAFYNKRTITEIILPSSLKEITTTNVYDGKPFMNCRALTKINFPEGLTSIGADAFNSCVNLGEINIPKTLTTIGDRAFVDCVKIEKISVDAENPAYKGENNALLTKNGETLILGCTNTQIPASVKTIGAYAFYGKNGINNLVIPEGVTTIGDRAFYGCAKLTNVVLPEGLTTIGKEAFAFCTGLKQINIPSTVTKMNVGLYCGSSEIEDSSIYYEMNEGEWVDNWERSTTSLGIDAFVGCVSISWDDEMNEGGIASNADFKIIIEQGVNLTFTGGTNALQRYNSGVMRFIVGVGDASNGGFEAYFSINNPCNTKVTLTTTSFDYNWPWLNA